MRQRGCEGADHPWVAWTSRDNAGTRCRRTIAAPYRNLADMDVAKWDFGINNHLSSHFWSRARSVGANMIERGYGRIVNVSSTDRSRVSRLQGARPSTGRCQGRRLGLD